MSLNSEGAKGKRRLGETHISNAITPSCVSSPNPASAAQKQLGKDSRMLPVTLLASDLKQETCGGLKKRVKSYNEPRWEIYLGAVNMLSNI